MHSPAGSASHLLAPDGGGLVGVGTADVGAIGVGPVSAGDGRAAVRPVCDNDRMPPSEPKIIRGHCPNCGSGRKAYVRCEHAIHSTDQDVGTSASDIGMVLECCGCERIYFRRDYWFSEWDTLGSDPISGEPRLERGVETVYWPAPARRQRPNWLDKIEASERDLGMLLDEMYAALDNDLRVLAAIAARTVFDRASQLLEVDPALGFKEKLDRLGADGRISFHEEEILQVLVDAGSAAAHRGWRPSVDELRTMVDVVETFLHRSFVLDGGIEKLKASVPARPKVRQRTWRDSASDRRDM